MFLYRFSIEMLNQKDTFPYIERVYTVLLAVDIDNETYSIVVDVIDTVLFIAASDCINGPVVATQRLYVDLFDNINPFLRN